MVIRVPWGRGGWVRVTWGRGGWVPAVARATCAHDMSAPRPQPSGSAVGFKQRLHHPFETPFVSDPAELGASRPPRVAGDAFERSSRPPGHESQARAATAFGSHRSLCSTRGSPRSCRGGRSSAGPRRRSEQRTQRTCDGSCRGGSDHLVWVCCDSLKTVSLRCASSDARRPAQRWRRHP